MKRIHRLSLAAMYFYVIAFSLTLSCSSASAETIISGVPAYAWYHGCGPTSIGMVLGYWDIHGYPNLFDAQGNDVYLTASVQDQISSPAHNAKYDPDPDISDSILPVPPYTSIADWCGTSVGSQPFGGSLVSNIAPAVVSYAAYRGYEFQTSLTRLPIDSTWNLLESEVNAGRPILFYVDADGDGLADHFVPAFGYDNNYNGDGRYYACYTTGSESETPFWTKFQSKTAGNLYGVYEEVQVTPQPTPEPSTMILLLAGAPVILIWLRLYRLRRRPSALNL